MLSIKIHPPAKARYTYGGQTKRAGPPHLQQAGEIFTMKNFIYFVLICASLWLYIFFYHLEAHGHVPLRKKAPNFSLYNLIDEKVELKELKGKIILLDFWASWCKPCKEEMPFLESLHLHYKDNGLCILGITVDSKRNLGLVKNIILQKKVTYPILLDSNQKVEKIYGVSILPTLFLIDKRGLIRFSRVGYTKVMEGEISAKVDSLVAELKGKPKLFFAGLKFTNKETVLTEVNEFIVNQLKVNSRFDFIQAEQGSPFECDYELDGNLTQIGGMIGIDFTLSEPLSKEIKKTVSGCLSAKENLEEMVKKLLNEVLKP
ncbi:MAG: redoxin domain-containing protein [Candidatus Edwardsbacteria bacterium]